MSTTTYMLTCLSPVHVGTGNQFSKFDSVYDNGRWHLIDLDKVLVRGVNANQLATAMTNRNFIWATWLASKGILPADVAAYVLPCPQDPNEVAVREVMKDVHTQPYLPGTSIKGAIRTAVLWSLLKQNNRLLQDATDYVILRLRSLELLQALDGIGGGNSKYSDPQAHRRAIQQVFGAERVDALRDVLHRVLGKKVDRLQRSDFERFAEWSWRHHRVQPNPRSLDDSIEQIVLGRTNYDLLRAVQVSDTRPASIEQLAIGMVWTYTLRGNRLVEKREQDAEYKIFAEWLTPETPLYLDLRVDDFLFSQAANNELHFRGAKEQAVRQLAQTCNAYAQSLITAEQKFSTDYPIFYAEREQSALREFYAELETTLNKLPDSAFLLNIGWGGGWGVKTVGDLLHSELGEDSFNQLRQRYRLGENPRTHQLSNPFPKTRHIAYDGGAPMWAMGWVRLVPS